MALPLRCTLQTRNPDADLAEYAVDQGSDVCTQLPSVLELSTTKEVVRLHHSARREYVVAEAALGDVHVHGEVTMHRLRLQESLQKHPLAGHDTPLNQQPFASRMLRIMQAESANIKLTGPQRTMPLAPHHESHCSRQHFKARGPRLAAASTTLRNRPIRLDCFPHW